VIELGRWGAQFLPPSLDGINLPSVGVMSLATKAFFRPQQAKGVHENYEFHIDNELLHIQIDDGALHVEQGAAPHADAVFHTEMSIFLGLFAGQIPAEEAIAGELIRIEGYPGALQRFLDVCGVPRVR
jgi:hypothetical protein